MAKHTPGPWGFEPETIGADQVLILDNDGYGLARVSWPGDGGSAVQGANAALIAAAPDMQDALDHPLLRQLLGEIEDSGTPEAARLWALAQAWIDVRDAAIAKAGA